LKFGKSVPADSAAKTQNSGTTGKETVETLTRLKVGANG